MRKSHSFLICVYLCPSVDSQNLSNRSEPIPPLPFLRELRKEAPALGFRGRGFDQGKRFAAREFEQIKIAQRVGDVKAEVAVLARAEKFSRAADFQIRLGNLKSIRGAHHGLQAHARVFSRSFGSDQDASSLFAAAADAPSQLMKLRK